MKRRASRFVLALLVLCFVLALASCGDNVNNMTAGNDGAGATKPATPTQTTTESEQNYNTAPAANNNHTSEEPTQTTPEQNDNLESGMTNQGPEIPTFDRSKGPVLINGYLSGDFTLYQIDIQSGDWTPIFSFHNSGYSVASSSYSDFLSNYIN